MPRFVSLFPTGVRNSNVQSRVIDNWEEGADTLHCVVDVTAGSPNLIVDIKGYDPVSGKYYTLLTSSTINTTGTTVLRIGPNYTAATNVAKDCLPAEWSVFVTQSGGVNATYSVGASVI